MWGLIKNVILSPRAEMGLRKSAHQDARDVLPESHTGVIGYRKTICLLPTPRCNLVYAGQSC